MSSARSAWRSASDAASAATSGRSRRSIRRPEARITWFDEDWQHPRKLSILAAALGDDGVLAGPTRSWFVDLQRGRARLHHAQRSLIFNGLAVRRAALEGVRFDEQRVRAADTAWVAAVRRQSRCTERVLPQVLSFWLCHASNISNPEAAATAYVPCLAASAPQHTTWATGPLPSVAPPSGTRTPI